MSRLHKIRFEWTKEPKLQALCPDAPHDIVFVVDENNIIRDCYFEDSGPRYPDCWLL